MAATLTSLDAALKETWTSNRLEEQLYQDNPFLDEIEKTTRYSVGAQAVTPLHVGRNGGYTALPAAGGTLNTAGEQKLAQATWNYTHHHVQVKIQGSAIDGTLDNSQSVANAVDVEVTGALNDLRKQLTRQAFSAGNALISGVQTGATSTITLDATDGRDAVERGWLYPGLFVDVGTTAAEASVINGEAITAVAESETAPTITVSSAANVTAGTHYVSVKDARSGTTSYEMNGLDNIVSATGTLGGISAASEPSWKASVDSTTTTLTLPTLYTQMRKVSQKTGGSPDYVLTSLHAQQAFYELLQMQTRFSGDQGIGAGNVGGTKFAGMSINAHPDVKRGRIYLLSKKNLFIVASQKPYWQNQVEGRGGKVIQWIQGEDAYGGKITYRINLATNKRNAHSAITALTY